MIQFVANHEDLSTDKGYQFKFFCDKCRNGHLSRFEASKVGIAGSLLRAAGQMFGGLAGSVSYSSHDLQRMVSGPEHDSALRKAMEEAKHHFRQCTKCGKWVCPQACWNVKANLCEDCAPDFHEHMAASQAQAKVDAVRLQLDEKARQMNYAGAVDMGADSQTQASDVAERPPSTPVCRHCGADVRTAKFCPECGQPTAAAKQPCGGCGAALEPGVKFCGECGWKVKQ